MRVWEVGNNKEIPTDLVREQDFILRVRRMQRTPTPCLVLNFVLNAVSPLANNHTVFETVQKKLQEFAQAAKGAFFEMSNGDVFIVWEGVNDVISLSNRIVDAILPEHSAERAQFLLAFHMPQDYGALRERANYYVEVVRAAATVSGDIIDKVEDAEGRLTAKSVDQIEHLLGEINLRPYGRTQNIYRKTSGAWEAIGEEYFVSFNDLRRERFPKLEIVRSDHFFMALCGLIDQRLLSMLTTSYEMIQGRRINLNLSVSSIVGSVFAHFVRRVPREQRHLIGFELHRGDLLQDFSLTLNTIEVLKREGFHVALDSITPDMVRYLDINAFNVDAIKVNVSEDRALQLLDPKIRQSFDRLPAEKLIFFRCDSERALATGNELGVKMFQGWLIDDLASKKS
jgi:EAL domain-containing protein (putative c-di-GMP-specific phosphodiesterase class I)